MRQKQVKPQKISKRKYRASYTEETLLKAYNEVKSKGLPVQTVAKKYGIPFQTLRDRVKGLVDPYNYRPGPETLFSREEELILVEHVEVMSQLGYGFTNVQLQHLAGELAFDFGRRKSNKALTNKWLYAFLGRWKDRLTSLNPRKLESNRAKGSSPEVVDSYYHNLEEVLDKYNLKDKPQFIYNLDETGLQPEHRPPNIIAPPNTKPQAITSPKSTTVTLIGCVNAIGNSLPPFFVFKGKRFSQDLMKGASPGSKAAMSESGWSNGTIFRQYLEEHFLPLTHSQINETQPILLLYDGHSSHISTTLIEWAKSHNIILFVLPPHTSHLLQPLDVGIFGPFKNYYHSECSTFLRNNMGQVITRYDMCEIACKAYLKSMTPSNIQSAFKRTGIYPFSKEVITPEKLFPTEVFREEEPIKKVNAIKSGKEEVKKFLDEKQQKMSLKEACNHCSENKPVIHKRPSAGGQAITEESFERKLKDYQDHRTKNNGSSSTKIKKTSSENTNIKSVSTVNKKQKLQKKLVYSPIPSTSGLNCVTISPKTSVSELQQTKSSQSEISSDDDLSDDDKCCVCNKFAPPKSRESAWVVDIMKWANCSNCSHWVHLGYCSEVRVVRRHSTFLCPHCVN